PSLVSWIKHSVDRFVIVSIFIPKLRLILILNSFLGSSDSLVFSELFHSLAPRPLAARSKIGRASCRERVEISVGAVGVKKNRRTVTIDRQSTVIPVSRQDIQR